MSRFLLVSVFLIAAVVLQVTAEPSCKNVHCPAHQQCYLCKPCPRTCENPNPVCTMECKLGPVCYCMPGYVTHNQKCIPESQCP
ncbi:serine protease inhibitor swm-1 [Microplitis demolitor]|uniref:serine protease inhibitor swm-1 n=1 Tax=Microplitis demolitor TaxID=69319 RepID=UPI0004CDBBD2|nr:serine protease inhibitor swm-1 [Microplitis demolitor]